MLGRAERGEGGRVCGWGFCCCCQAHFQVTLRLVREVVEVEQAGINSPIIVCFYREGLARTVGVYFLDWIDLRNGISPFVCRHLIAAISFFFDRKYVPKRIFTAFWGLLDFVQDDRTWRGWAFEGATAALTCCKVLWVRLVVSGFDHGACTGDLTGRGIISDSWHWTGHRRELRCTTTTSLPWGVRQFQTTGRSCVAAEIPKVIYGFYYFVTVFIYIYIYTTL